MDNIAPEVPKEPILDIFVCPGAHILFIGDARTACIVDKSFHVLPFEICMPVSVAPNP